MSLTELVYHKTDQNSHYDPQQFTAPSDILLIAKPNKKLATSACTFAPVGVLVLFVLPLIWLIFNFNRPPLVLPEDQAQLAASQLEQVLGAKPPCSNYCRRFF